jgi:hypothetical protein
MIRYFSLFMFLIAFSVAHAERSRAVWQGPDRAVYVVTRNHYAEGFNGGAKTPRFGDLIVIEIYSPMAGRSGESAVYKVGERIALFEGGQRGGSVQIEKVMPLQCDSSAALVSAGPSLHLAKDAMALATNSERIRPHSNFQRQASAIEQGYAKELARNEFQKRGVPKGVAREIQADHLVVTRVDGSEDWFLIGLLYAESEAARHEVFLIGKLGSSGATTELARYHKTTDLEDGKDSANVRFVDQLDLDNDGTDEIVVEVTGYENEEFGIYSRRNGSWKLVHVGGRGGC